MDFDYSEYEYLPECSSGCGALTDWLCSNDAAEEVVHNHGRQTGHHWQIQRRMREDISVTRTPLPVREPEY